MYREIETCMYSWWEYQLIEMIFSRVYFCDTNQNPSIYMLTQAIQFLGTHPKKKKKKNEAT